MEETKTFKIPWEGKEEEVTIQAFDYGTWLDIEEQAVDVKMIGRQTITKPNMRRTTLLGIMKSLKKAPFPITEQSIRQLPKKVGELIYNEISKLNGMGENSDAKNSEGQSETPKAKETQS